MSAVEGETGRCFVDTNLWLYTFISGQDTDKSVRAKKIIQSINPVISTQVINEVCVNRVLYSEDMQNGLVVRETLRIVNPFSEA